MNLIKGNKALQHSGGQLHSSNASNLFWTFAGVTIVTYVLFQKHLLPKSVSKHVAKLFFWPTMPITMAMRISNYWTVMDDTVLLGAAPMKFLGHPNALHKLGVRGIINMCDEFCGPLKEYEELGIKQLRLRTVDHTVPDLNTIKRGVEFIRRFEERNEKVLVHCKAGHGRSASVVMAWLLYKNPKSTPASMQKYMLDRRHVSPKLHTRASILSFYEEQKSENTNKVKEM